MARVVKARRSKKVHLCKLEEIFNFKTSDSLFDLVNQSWKYERKGDLFCDDWELREYSHSPEEKYVISVGGLSKDTFFGQLVCIDPSGFHLVAKMQKGATLELDQIDSNDGESPIRGSAYFLIHGDWVMFIDCGVRLNRLARYLSHIIANTYDVSSGLHLTISPRIKINKNAASKIQAKKLVLKPAPVALPTPIEARSETSQTRKVGKENVLWDMLAAIGLGKSAFGYTADNVDLDGSLELEVTLKYRKKGKLLNIGSLPIAQVAELFDAREIQLQSKDSTVIGNIAKVSHEVLIDSYGTILSTQSVKSCLSEAFEVFREQGLFTL